MKHLRSALAFPIRGGFKSDDDAHRSNIRALEAWARRPLEGVDLFNHDEQPDPTLWPVGTIIKVKNKLFLQLKRGTWIPLEAIVPAVIQGDVQGDSANPASTTTTSGWHNFADGPSVYAKAPGSGKVLVTVGAVGWVTEVTTNTALMSFQIYRGTQLYRNAIDNDASSVYGPDGVRSERTTLVSGLVPEETYEFRAAHRVTGGRGNWHDRRVLVRPTS